MKNNSQPEDPSSNDGKQERSDQPKGDSTPSPELSVDQIALAALAEERESRMDTEKVFRLLEGRLKRKHDEQLKAANDGWASERQIVEHLRSRNRELENHIRRARRISGRNVWKDVALVLLVLLVLIGLALAKVVQTRADAPTSAAPFEHLSSEGGGS